jgi:hypothetical protein
MRQAMAAAEHATLIDWAQVEREAVFESISGAGCEPYEIAQTIANHSAGSVPALRAAAAATRIEHQAAALERLPQATTTALRDLGRSH